MLDADRYALVDPAPAVPIRPGVDPEEEPAVLDHHVLASGLAAMSLVHFRDLNVLAAVYVLRGLLALVDARGIDLGDFHDLALEIDVRGLGDGWDDRNLVVAVHHFDPVRAAEVVVHRYHGSVDFYDHVQELHEFRLLEAGKDLLLHLMDDGDRQLH